jgi:heme-degrading monooxygenase HmoA
LTPPEEVVEHAEITIPSGAGPEFVGAVVRGREVIAAAPGCRWVELYQGVERPEVYFLRIGWDRLEDHERFRRTPAFAEWRSIVGPFFAGPPSVEHMVKVIDS